MTTEADSERLTLARQTLEAVRQSHVLDGFDSLCDEDRRALLDQVESVDWQEVDRLVETYVRAEPELHLPGSLEPAPWYPHAPTPELESKYTEARDRGESLVSGGKVAVFTVAGGQGTRLGWDAPKGTFPATPIRRAPLFRIFAEAILRTQERYGAIVPWYVMTSPINDWATRDFFEQHAWFGLDAANVTIFPQAMMPAVSREEGRALLEAPGRIALAPNGHGGSLKALAASGALDDMRRRHVEQISYIQVDNPLVKPIDPLFIGLHAIDDAQMSSKMIAKRDPMEKVGNFCLADGKVSVIEYSDLPESLARETLPTGELRFRAGSIAIHVIAVDFVGRLNAGPGGFGLPWHRADKKVPVWDAERGETVKPDEPNGVKFETFVFDALPLADRSIVYETRREEEFAPIKNASSDGVLDSPETSRLAQIERAASWLTSAGVSVPRSSDGSVDAVLEVKPSTAIDAADLNRIELPRVIAPGGEYLI